MYRRCHVKYALLLPDLNQMCISREILKNIQISNFAKIRPVTAEMFHAYAGTDAQAYMTMPIFAFRNFAEAPKNEFYQNCCLRNHL